MKDQFNKCITCVGKYDYKTAIPCRYCKWNVEQYWGREESKMINDSYVYVKSDKNCKIPF